MHQNGPSSDDPATRVRAAREALDARTPAQGRAAAGASGPGATGPARLAGLQRAAGNRAVARLLGTIANSTSPPPRAAIQRQVAPAIPRSNRRDRDRRAQEAAEQAGHTAESIRNAMGDARARAARRREGRDRIEFALEQADGLTATQADEARLISRYPALGRAAVRQPDFDLAREHNDGFQRACASFVRTRDLTDLSMETLSTALECSQDAGAMLVAFTQRRETTLTNIEGRIKGALGHISSVVKDRNETEFERERQQWERVHPSASDEDKARFRSQWGPLTAAQESRLLGDFAAPLTQARDLIEQPAPDLRQVHGICAPLGPELKTLLAGTRGAARAELSTAADMLRGASGMLTVLIDPKRAARTLAALLLECETLMQRLIDLPRRHDPTMPPGPDNPDPHRYRPRGLVPDPGETPVEIEPLAPR